MADLYDFAWVHQEARSLKHGRMVLELSVKDGVIQMVELVEVRKRRTIEDVRRSKESLVEPL